MNARVLSRNWWMFALRGLLAVLFGLAAFVWPGLTLFVLVMLFGAYVLVDGAFAVVAGVMHRDGPHWGWVVLEGLFGLAAGAVAFLWPDITALVLLYLIAVWAVVTGVIEIVAAVALRREIENEWTLGLAGALSLGLGVLIVIWPGASALAVAWLIGAYAIVFGVLLIVLGFKLRSWTQPMERVRQAPASAAPPVWRS